MQNRNPGKLRLARSPDEVDGVHGGEGFSDTSQGHPRCIYTCMQLVGDECSLLSRCRSSSRQSHAPAYFCIHGYAQGDFCDYDNSGSLGVSPDRPTSALVN